MRRRRATTLVLAALLCLNVELARALVSNHRREVAAAPFQQALDRATPLLMTLPPTARKGG